MVTLFALHSQNAGKLAHLLRYQKSESPQSASGKLEKAMDQALDELARETGLEV